MKKVFVVFLIFVFGTAVFAEAMDEHLERDATLDALVESLETIHPDLYARYSPEEFQDEIAHLRSSMYMYDDLEFALSLSHLTSMVGDSHTSIKFGSVVQSSKVIPLGLDYFSDGYRAIVLPKEFSSHIGDVVVSIDGIDIESCLARLGTIISYDNEVWLKRQAMDMFTYSSILEFVGISDKHSDKVEIEFESGATIALGKMSMDELRSIETARAFKGEGGISARRKVPYFFELDDEVVYIQYNTCRNNPDYTFQYMVDEISKLDFEAIVIDLRNNGGGSDGVIWPLFELLKKKPYPVYCLIGENTFSSAVINTAQLDAWFDAILVGAPTGGSANHFGSLDFVELPNGLGVSISTKSIDLDAFFEGKTNYGWTSISPDFTVEESYGDYVNGIDKAYDFIKNDLI